MVRIPHADVLHPWNLCEIFGYKNRKTARDSSGLEMVDSICVFSCSARENYCIDQCLYWFKQLSTGQLPFDGFESHHSFPR